MSEDQKDQKKRTITELKFPLPDVRISFDSHFDIISAYVVASNNGKNPVGYKELEPYVKIDPTMISGCNKFFQHLGIITASDKIGKYIPTNFAIEIHNGRKWKNDDMTKSALRKILDKSWFGMQTRQFLEVNQTVSKSDLIQKLGLSCGADPDKHARALDKLVEYMQFSELIKEDNGNFILNDIHATIPESLEEMPQENSESQIISEPRNPIKVQSKISSNNVGINFGILISTEATEEQIRKAVRTVVDELKKIQSEEGDHDG